MAQKGIIFHEKTSRNRAKSTRIIRYFSIQNQGKEILSLKGDTRKK